MVEGLQVGEGKVGLARSQSSIFGSEAGANGGKSEFVEGSAGASPLCPQCNSKKVYRDGLRYKSDKSSVQRWLCRDCGFRFSKRPLQETSKRSLNTSSALASKRQICALGAKNLSATELKTVAGDKKKPSFPFAIVRNLDLIPEDARGLLTKFMAYLEREGFAAENQYPVTLSHLVKDGANLLDPENVKSVIAKQRKKNGEPWSDSMKMLACCAYDAFCQMQEMPWRRPIYHQNEATVPVPDEKDLDMLISAARKQLATYLGCLKETFADPSEILRCDWVDLKDNVLSINHPVKGHYSGKYELTPRLLAMLNALPRKKKRIFPTTYKTIYASLFNLRTKAAERFQNPALLQITFKSFRHWGGSMLAYKTNGNQLIIMRVLRHKSYKSSLRYIHTIEFKDEDFDTTVATTPEEIQQLGKAGWIKYDEMTINGVQMHFYRKPKRFGGFKGGLEKQDNKDEKRVDRFLCSA
jgi:integrase/ribosomal protein L37AE/L43A